jgi:hypothetical protein
LQRHSPPLPWIVPAFDIVKDIRSGLSPHPVLPPIPPLTFEHPKETFGRHIVRATANGAHAADDAVCD